MYCYQCEQTSRGVACSKFGVCGKGPDVASLQDLLIHAAKGVSMYAHRAGKLGLRDREIDLFVVESLFTTVTNVNFDPERLQKRLARASDIKNKAKDLYERATQKAGNITETLSGPAQWKPASDLSGLISEGEKAGIETRIKALGNDIAGLQELLLYGLKGMAAYVDHATILGREDQEIYAFFHEAMDFLAQDEVTPDALLGMILRCGEVNLKVMGMLDEAHTSTFGHPVPTKVRTQPVKGKAILISGHDLKDLQELLEQTEGLGINIYTHGEMLPAHGYPKLKKYAHLAGNYGGAWQDQQKEFAAFPGAILMTTNCIQCPHDEYKDRIFTSGLVAWPGVVHITDRDFSPVIRAAQAAPGFAESGSNHEIMVGFGHQAVMNVADKVIAGVKAGAIRHFFLIGGCDGAKSGRNYYTRIAEALPKDCVILTLACGKYRFNKLDFGDIGGIPRLLDIGQCNDAYSAIQIALALAEAFDTDVNSLPLSLILSWYEQKAVVILLTLLHLGLKNIRLGPSLPAFITPSVLQILSDKFNIMPISTPEKDLESILGK